MRLKKYDIKKSLKLNYNIMIVVIFFTVSIQILSLSIFQTVSAARIECDVDMCVGTIEDDYIEGMINAESPTIFGKGGNDEIYGTNNNDHIEAGNGDDQIYGNIDNDLLWGGYGDDEIYGGEGDDMIEGDEGSDTINGGKGNDELTGSKMYNGDPDYSKDTITCGLGDDTVYINVSEDGDKAADDCENVITE